MNVTAVNEDKNKRVKCFYYAFYFLHNKLFNNLFGRNFNMRQQHQHHGQQHNHIGQLIDYGMGGNWRHTADYRLHAAAERNL